MHPGNRHYMAGPRAVQFAKECLGQARGIPADQRGGIAPLRFRQQAGKLPPDPPGKMPRASAAAACAPPGRPGAFPAARQSNRTPGRRPPHWRRPGRRRTFAAASGRRPSRRGDRSSPASPYRSTLYIRPSSSTSTAVEVPNAVCREGCRASAARNRSPPVKGFQRPDLPQPVAGGPEESDAPRPAARSNSAYSRHGPGTAEAGIPPLPPKRRKPMAARSGSPAAAAKMAPQNPPEKKRKLPHAPPPFPVALRFAESGILYHVSLRRAIAPRRRKRGFACRILRHRRSGIPLCRALPPVGRHELQKCKKFLTFLSCSAILKMSKEFDIFSSAWFERSSALCT